ncbi:hypothetical protein OPT61_g59 [Boeremia exigua]|uniref:Uncharacterized protein n=1 Tax=Boeremia exigua TaxID=749465 RepID=A0ACC2IV43_9PLEO|nr:hypothetical protein OPT61_g59 [Boeremia exigua]
MRFNDIPLLLVSSVLVSAVHYNPTPTATIDAGVVFGRATALPNGLGPSVNQFLGIPFAQSPPERFSPPRNVTAFNRPLNATAWKPACIQQFRYPLASQQFAQAVFNNPGGPPPVESEDCLYLNIYAPSGSPGGNGRAVMFWLYGGSLQFGTAGLATYDGSALADYEDVVVVTTNYRTNVFGFPASPELPMAERNLGFLDQRFALDWVQRNIHAFGGDPSKVTIFGESAGGFSVDALLTSYPKSSKPPFRAAILQSGQYSYRAAAPMSSVPAWNNLTASLSCPGAYASNLTCVRAANATEVKRVIEVNSLIFNPTPDNVTLFQNPAARRLGGNISSVPVLIGSNSQEGRVFAVGQTNFSAFLQTTFGAAPALIPAIAAAYPIGSPGITNGYDAISAVITDATFQCPTALWANATVSIGIPTWRYYFNASFSNTQAYPQLGAYHASEIPLVFGTYPKPNTTTQEFALAAFMKGAWARFAKNPSAGPGWNPVGTGQAGSVLSGAYEQVADGIYYGGSGNTTTGSWNLGVLGDIGRSVQANLPGSCWKRWDAAVVGGFWMLGWTVGDLGVRGT